MRILLALTVLILLSAANSQAQDEQTYAVGQVLSDGKDGRAWKSWRQAIPDVPVERVEATLRRVKGGKDTFVNLRFGDSQTFENGKRVPVVSPDLKTVGWNVAGASPGTQPLVLNAYLGEVEVTSVTVFFGEKAAAPIWTPPAAATQAPDTGNPVAQNRCKNMKIRAPRIEISDAKATGGLFSGKFRVSGIIEGICIEEAGYYENGKLKERFPIGLTDTFKRTDFEVRVKTGENGEIRAYAIDGREDSIEIDELVADQSRQY